MCAFHHNLSHGFYRVMSVKFLFLKVALKGSGRTTSIPYIIVNTTKNNIITQCKNELEEKLRVAESLDELCDSL